MNKVVSILIAVFVVSFSVIPFLFSYNAYATAPSLETYLPEPDPEDGNQFWFVVSDGSLVNSRLYGLYLTSDDPNVITNSCFINIYPDGSYHFIAYNDDTQLAIGYIWMIFDIYGTLQAKSSGVINSNSNHNFNVGRNYSNGYIYYWGTSNIGRQGTTQPDQLQILWNQNITYHNIIKSDLSGLASLLSDIDNGIALLHSDFTSLTSIVNSILTRNITLVSNTNSLITKVNTILTNWDWFKTTYYNSILDCWSINQQQLDTIIELLGGEEDTTYFSDNSELASDVNGFVNSEQNYIDRLNNIQNDIDNAFDVQFRLDMANNGLIFISNLFNSLFSSLNPGLVLSTLLIFSMVMGLVLLILGRSLHK